MPKFIHFRIIMHEYIHVYGMYIYCKGLFLDHALIQSINFFLLKFSTTEKRRKLYNHNSCGLWQWVKQTIIFPCDSALPLQYSTYIHPTPTRLGFRFLTCQFNRFLHLFCCSLQVKRLGHYSFFLEIEFVWLNMIQWFKSVTFCRVVNLWTESWKSFFNLSTWNFCC